MPNGTPIIIRLCDHRGECLDVDHQLRIDGKVVEIEQHNLDAFMGALDDADFELTHGEGC